VQYHFRTDWRFRAPLARTWPVIVSLERYPGWWKDFRRVRLRSGDGRRPGSIFDCETRGALPYSLRYSLELLRVEEPRLIELRSAGDLIGTGRWELSSPHPSESLATYYWDVATTNPLLNLLAPLARGLFARNHEQVMARGYEALRRHLETPVP